MKDKERVRRLQDDCNEPKEKLMTIQDRLEEAGAKVEAEQLGKIIWRLERWQNKSI